MLRWSWATPRILQVEHCRGKPRTQEETEGKQQEQQGQEQEEEEKEMAPRIDDIGLLSVMQPSFHGLYTQATGPKTELF